MFLAKRCTTYGLPEIGQRIGGRDRTKVLHAVREMAALAERVGAPDEDTPEARAASLLERLTASHGVGLLSHMKAEALLEERIVISASAFVEIVVWRVPRPLRGSAHAFKYRLAYVVDGLCVLRYDNEGGKGDHVHRGAIQKPYAFTTPERLLADFWRDIEEWRPQ